MTGTGETKVRFGLRGAVRRERRNLVACLALLLCLFPVQAARGVTVQAQLERASIFLGDSVELEVIVSDSSGGSISAEIPRVDGLDIRRTGSGWRLENLRRSDVLNYVVTASREGRFVIPPIAVQVNGQRFTANQLVLTVRRSSDTKASMRLVASVSRKECYVLEAIDVTFTWYISADVRQYQMTLPLLEEKDELSLKPVPSGVPEEEVRANRYSLRARRSSEKLDGEDYTAFTLRFRIFPPEAGSYTIRRATVVAQVQTGSRITTDVFGARRVPTYQRGFAASEPITLTVRDLPTEGKPAGFTGAVGTYSISVEADERRVKVGDPIPIRILISGKGLLEKVKRPVLSENGSFAKDFSISESLAPGEVSGNRVTFEQTIRATSEDVKEIPSVAFAYFNPDRGAYETATSKAIPLTVLPTTQVTANDVVKFGPAVSPGATTRLEEQPGGILANYNHLDALRNQGVRWAFLPFLGVLPAAYLVVLAFVSRRRKLAGDTALARAKSAKKVLKRHLADARKHVGEEDRRFYDLLARGVSRFTSDKLNLGTGELTAYDVEALVREERIPEEISRELSDLLVRCDEGRFAPSAHSAEERNELLRRAEELIGTLERAL